MVGNPHRTSARAKLLGSLDGCGAASALSSTILRLHSVWDQAHAHSRRAVFAV
jgi:hypothetical protein